MILDSSDLRSLAEHLEKLNEQYERSGLHTTGLVLLREQPVPLQWDGENGHAIRVSLDA